MIHQQVLHHARRHTEEVRAGLLARGRLAYHLQIGFMHQGRRLQGMIRTLVLEHAPARRRSSA